MEYWSSWISLGGTAIALFTLAFTIVKYNKHEKRLNEQQNTINEYQLRRIHEEETSTLKAEIKGNICRHTKGSDQLKVFNAGKANATNIRIEIIGSQDGLMIKPFEIIELLNPQQGYNYEIYLTENHVKTLKIKFIWDDESGKDREIIEYLQIA